MGILSALWLIVLGVLAVPGLIIAKRPDAKKIIDKLAPFQGWIGIASVIWGIYGLIHWFASFGLLGHGVRGIVAFLIGTIYVFTMIGLGFLLGIGVIKMFVKDPNAQAKMDQMLAKLSPKQGALGLLALADGVVLLIVSLVPSLLY